MSVDYWKPRSSVTAWEMYELTDSRDWANLTTEKKQLYSWLLRHGGKQKLIVGMKGLFPADTVTGKRLRGFS